MMILKAQIWPSLYQDSVILMRVAAEIRRLPEVDEAASFMGTPANHAILEQSAMANDVTATAGPNDLLFSVRAATETAADTALKRAHDLLNESRPSDDNDDHVVRPKTITNALRTMPDASLALLSIPGNYVKYEAERALKKDLHVMIFSDNVPVEDEVALKSLAADRGLLCMGPDCGTAYINGKGLAFANMVKPGRVGCIAASGTGLQAVACRLDAIGIGVSQGIGVGGRDLSADVGGTMTFAALDILASDPATDGIVVITKPPAPEVAAKLNEVLAKIGKPTIVCASGVNEISSEGIRWIGVLDDAADAIHASLEGRDWSGVSFDNEDDIRADLKSIDDRSSFHGGVIHGYYTGGTLAYEACGLLADLIGEPRSNLKSLDGDAPNLVLDLGEDAYTIGRPHPMIEPEVRSDAIISESKDDLPQIVLADLVLGTGSHEDPAAALAGSLIELRERADKAGKAFAAAVAVVGTDADPQDMTSQVETLKEAGAFVFRKNSEAVRFAAMLSRPDLEQTLLQG